MEDHEGEDVEIEAGEAGEIKVEVEVEDEVEA